LALSESDKIPVYFMPGMAASPTIFKGISLPAETFEMIWLDWFVPDKGMTLKEYATAMCSLVKHPNPVLIGVSFGGLLVQEMARQLEVRKVIIISSVKHSSELPKRMLIARYTRIHRLLPTGLVNSVELLSKFAFGENIGKRLELYEQYLSLRDKYYIDWCIDQMVNWKQEETLPHLVHIHGEKDAVFPIQYIKNCISVKNGTHTMIIHRYKWFNERLPAIILEERSSI
jgi:pimeloyl-ACP methyl ester carboxylesterase